MIKLLYNGVNIYPRVFLDAAVHETYAENRCDSIMLRFIDNEGNWDKWQPKHGDTLRFSFGSADTGLMYFSHSVFYNGLYSLVACSMPPSCGTYKTKTWERVSFIQILKSICETHGLEYQIYGVTDWVYSYLKQSMQTDLEFLNLLCRLEGYAMVIYDGNIIIYDERSREQTEASGTIKIGINGTYSYSDTSVFRYGAAEVEGENFYGRYVHDENGRILRRKVKCGSDTEATRFAKNLLYNANKGIQSGYFRGKLRLEYAPASVISLETERAVMWDGKAFVTMVRHDYFKEETKIFFRKPLEGY